MNDDLRKDLIKDYRIVEEREESPYDGVVGELPHFPESFQNEFKKIRAYLLKDYSHEELLH